MIVSQLGARMHYAVPRILHAAGRLEHFYTDICAARGWPQALGALPPRFLPRAARRLIGRQPADLPASRITSFDGVGMRFALQRALAGDPTAATRAHIRAGQALSRQVLRRLDRHQLDGGVYGFSGECLELLTGAKARGFRTAVEQIVAPKKILDRLTLEEEALHPGWSPVSIRDGLSEEYAARERGEWAAADVILCGSEFVRDGVISCGGQPERCVVTPYGVQTTAPILRRRSGPLKVLTVGSVGLRKGAPYVLEAALRLKGVAEFRMAGALDVSENARRRLNEAVKLLGPVPRSEMSACYAWADVFLLPSICEGSATVLYEALMAGLPVVTTPNAGSVVRHGVDGFLTPIRDPDAIEAALAALARDAELYRAMAGAARRRGLEHSLQEYSSRLLAALDRLAPEAETRTPLAASA
ncbi:glycosyltransferase family 4 protein [Hansschlegelia beijingensis]